MLWALGIGAHAGTNLPDVADELARCAGIAESPQRLQCYDTLAGRDAPSPEAAFGRETRPDRGRPPGDEPAQIDSVAVRVEQRPRGERVFHLDNGQVWTEVSAGRGRYPDGVAVRIERTAMGGYMLVTDRGQATRVRRIQ